MGANTAIEWTEATWNPVTGCTKVSAGCDNCYAETLHERFNGKGSFAIVNRSEDKLYLPLTWRKPRRVFVNSMSDLFHDDVPDGFIARVFGTMARTPQHTYQLLTKRHGRMRSLLNKDSFRDNLLSMVPGAVWPLPNLWLGVSVENQEWADLRVRHLLQTPAAVRWLSMEPLLGPVDLSKVHAGAWLRLNALTGAYTDPYGEPPVDAPPAFARGLDWVVVGGESGPKARPMMPIWAQLLRDQCTAANVPFFFKQWGTWMPHKAGTKPGAEIRAYPGAMVQRVGKKLAGRELDGRTWDEYPAVAR